MATLNPFERIRSTDGKIFLLLVGLVLTMAGFEALRGRIGSSWSVLIVEALVVFLYVGWGTYGTIKIVARPVRRAVEHFTRISDGDYSKPVLTRRVDEFGDMLRALDTMRIRLRDAVAAREEAERRYRQIVERSVQGFYQATMAEGDLIAANETLAHMLGYESTNELMADGKSLGLRIQVDPARRTEYLHQLKTLGTIRGFETAVRRRDGRVIWVTHSARLVRDEQGKPRYLEGFLDDITARKEAEQLKADFVSFVTHQLRTPLSGIRWMLELARDGPLDDETASFLADAQASAERLIGLVNDLLDIARLEAGRLEVQPAPIELGQLVNSVAAELAPLARAKHHRVDIEGTAPPTFADPQLTRQAVLNLVSNAIKYTPDEGRITIELDYDDRDVSLSVCDTGIGISMTAQKRLFEKFFRAENALTVDTEGTGLGLYLVKLIAERSGGSISVHSVERQGSTFTLRLPRAAGQKAIA
jgi:PAS domain S-box-containing protein